MEQKPEVDLEEVVVWVEVVEGAVGSWSVVVVEEGKVDLELGWLVQECCLDEVVEAGAKVEWRTEMKAESWFVVEVQWLLRPETVGPE